jgi:site-specific DNA-methyltransferase (adenine-specific)
MNTFANQALNSVIIGDCVDVLRRMPSESVDFVLTDPPYLSSYRPRDGRTVQNDSNDSWLRPSFAELFRVLRRDSLCVTFYGWPFADLFVSAFRAAGFRPVSHLSFVKSYSSFTGYTRAQHEVAYILAKGSPSKPMQPPSDVQNWRYTGNKIHPTQKPVSVLRPLVHAFSKPGDIVLDPFCGSGSTLVAARNEGRRFLGIEIDPLHAAAATRRLESECAGRAA